jgi:predicted Zn finger-like uncharacterized protein
MSMVTSCPACATTFRVVQEQLKARQGKVRCGKCTEVFDAFKTLASYPDEALPEPTAPRASESHVTRDPEFMRMQSALDIGPASIVNAPHKVATRWRGTRSADANKRYLVPLAVLLAIAFMLQLIYAMRTALANSIPGLRPQLERICDFAGCTVPLPRRTESLAIESSDLQADLKRPGVIVLTAALRNRGSAPLELPALELTLTNAQDQAIARRIFLPKDYVERAQELGAGMRASAEYNVRIELDTGELRAAGYRLFLFYP